MRARSAVRGGASDLVHAGDRRIMAEPATAASSELALD
jgi:hypothetical protein